MNDILYLWEKSKNFKIEENGEIFDYSWLAMMSGKIKSGLLGIDNRWENKTVYIDIKDRKIFILLFITLKILNSKIVLVPIEIASADFIAEDIVYISDNKKLNEGIFIDKYFEFHVGNNFNFSVQTGIVYDNTPLFLYTSGSTGKAKLIPKNDFNLLTELKELEKILEIKEGNVFYFTPPLYHIYGFLFGLLLPLYTNSHLMVDYHFTPESVAKFVSEHEIDFFVSIPAYYNMFCDLDLVDSFKKCKKLTSSSAPLSIEISKKFFDRGIKIIEVYGSTETGGIAHRTGAESESWKLFSYVDVINTKKGHGTEIEENNELIITSPAISTIYDENIGYNTGDVVEFHDTDNFILLGRNTRFVKIKGKRIDLNYITKKIMNYMKSLSNFEIKEDNLFIGEKDEVIFVIFEFNFPKNNTEMKKDLKDLLPGYAVPKYFMNMKIPRNSMGKINKVEINNLVDEMKKR
jgi:acyl-coenzyme A synthetase/AMP-(fatty) acid ligase